MVNLSNEELEAKIKEYTTFLETAETDKVCSCFWAVHPDDVHIPEGACRVCEWASNSDHPTEAFSTGPNAWSAHEFRPRRVRLFDTDAFCPVHTKEGLLKFFIQWLEKKVVTEYHDREFNVDDPTIETHEFKQHPEVPSDAQKVCVHCGKWPLHHSHTGNRAACTCKECS